MAEVLVLLAGFSVFTIIRIFLHEQPEHSRLSVLSSAAKPMLTNLRSLTTGELLDESVALYRRHFRLFFGIAAGPQLALLVCELTIRIPTEIKLHRFLPLFSGRGLLLFLGALVAGSIAQGAITHAVSAIHLGRPVNILSAYSAIQPQIAVILMISVLLSIGFILGIVFLLIPTLLIIARYSFSTCAAVIERLGVRASLKRSGQLSAGSKGRVLLVYGLYLAVFLSIVLGLARISVLLFGAVSVSTPAILFRVFSAGVNRIFVSPLASIAMTLLYYDQRVKKEGFDIQHMLADLAVEKSLVAASD